MKNFSSILFEFIDLKNIQKQIFSHFFIYFYFNFLITGVVFTFLRRRHAYLCLSWTWYYIVVFDIGLKTNYTPKRGIKNANVLITTPEKLSISPQI